MKTTITITLLTLAAALIPGSTLELQRGGSVWRIVTCHFTHFTYEQLAWDVLVFLILGIACARRNRGAFQATLLASILVVPIAVLVFAPNVTTYRGLSGIDSALFALPLTMESKRNRLVALCAIGFAMKLIFEMTTGATMFVSAADFAPVPVAHLSGAIVGLTIGVLWRHEASKQSVETSDCDPRQCSVDSGLCADRAADAERLPATRLSQPDARLVRALDAEAQLADQPTDVLYINDDRQIARQRMMKPG